MYRFPSDCPYSVLQKPYPHIFGRLLFEVLDNCRSHRIGIVILVEHRKQGRKVDSSQLDPISFTEVKVFFFLEFEGLRFHFLLRFYPDSPLLFIKRKIVVRRQTNAEAVVEIGKVIIGDSQPQREGISHTVEPSGLSAQYERPAGIPACVPSGGVPAVVAHLPLGEKGKPLPQRKPEYRTSESRHRIDRVGTCQR